MLASGVTGNAIRFALDDFLAQIDDMQVAGDEPGRGAPKEDWFSTHPFSPLRVKALSLFAESALAKPGGMPAAELEARVQTLMALMEPSYLEERSEAAEAMRRLLFAAAIAVAGATGGISEKEIEVFERFFGKGAFSERLNLERIEAELGERIEAVRDRASRPRRLQILRDLCLIARADGSVSPPERAVMREVADGLEVPATLVEQILDCGFELD